MDHRALVCGVERRDEVVRDVLLSVLTTVPFDDFALHSPVAASAVQ
jgi:hypothetical protein